MKTILIPSHDIILESPDAQRDAPFALAWFDSTEGKNTLLSMGNIEHEIQAPSIQQQVDIMNDFITMQKTGIQLTWIIRHHSKSIGAVWLQLKPKRGVRTPSLHILLGDHSLRNKGIGTAVMGAVLDYALNECNYPVVYTRHLAKNAAVDRMNEKLGFKHDGDTYADSMGLVWQNVKMTHPDGI